MKKILMTLVAVATLGFAGGDIAPVQEPVVVAEAPFTGFYVGGAITANETYVNGEKKYFGDDDYTETAYGLGLVGGYVFYNDGRFSVAGELRGARSFWAESEGMDYTYNYGAFIRPEVYVFDNTVGLYGLAGYAKTAFVPTAGETVDESGFAYGVGAEYFVSKELSVFVDYTMLPDFDAGIDERKINNDQVQLGVSYRF